MVLIFPFGSGRYANFCLRYMVSCILCELTGSKFKIFNPLKVLHLPVHYDATLFYANCPFFNPSHLSQQSLRVEDIDILLKQSITLKNDGWIKNEHTLKNTINQIINNPQNIIADCYGQTSYMTSLYKNYKTKLFKKEYIDLNKKYKPGFFVHLRCGDIAHLDNRLPELEYFEQAILTAKADGESGQGILSSDIKQIRSNHPEAFKKWSKIIENLTEKFDLQIYDYPNAQVVVEEAIQYQTKIISSGTLSWLIGFLGSQNVYCPKQDGSRYTLWHGDFYDPMWKHI